MTVCAGNNETGRPDIAAQTSDHGFPDWVEDRHTEVRAIASVDPMTLGFEIFCFDIFCFLRRKASYTTFYVRACG
ncbi:MAG: hypothetical protein ACLFV6_02145 [Spirulinaceae cyanobacterium]